MTDRNKTLEHLIEAARLLGITQARQIYGQYTIADGQVEGGLHKKIDQYRAKLAQPEPVSLSDEAKRFALMQGGGGAGGRGWFDGLGSGAGLARPEQEPVNGYTKSQVHGYTAPPKFAQPEQEPVAWMQDSVELYVNDCPTESYTIPLYTAPPKREWVGLTEGELIDIKDCNRGFWTNAAKIEQLLKDKNT